MANSNLTPTQKSIANRLGNEPIAPTPCNHTGEKGLTKREHFTLEIYKNLIIDPSSDPETLIDKSIILAEKMLYKLSITKYENK